MNIDQFESRKIMTENKETQNITEENTENLQTSEAEASDDWAQNEEAAIHLTEAVDDELEALRAENAKLKDAMLRALAEAENTRKRAEKQISDGRNFAITSFARELLSVVDNLRRALASVPENERDEKAQNILTGVEMTEKELIKVLEKNNVLEVAAEGSLFDPNLHEAMFEIPNPEVTAGTILTVVDSGWTIGERLLRPAKVGVATGGAKPNVNDKADN